MTTALTHAEKRRIIAHRYYYAHLEQEKVRRREYREKNRAALNEKSRIKKAALAMEFAMERGVRIARGEVKQATGRTKMSPAEKKEAVRRNNAKQWARREALGINAAQKEARAAYAHDYHQKRKNDDAYRAARREHDRAYKKRAYQRLNG